MFEVVKNNKNNKFYAVEEESILKAESGMGLIIPKSLKLFFKNVGYGFIETKSHNINRIMDPESIQEFFFEEGQFENLEEASLIKKYTRDKIVFFEANESLYLSIGTTKKNNGKIFYYNENIADSLEDFFDKYSKDEKYFLTK